MFFVKFTSKLLVAINMKYYEI